MLTEVLPFTDEAIARAADLIRAGQPVAVPTETVYGLAADATNAQAVAAIYTAKGRPSFNPLIVHVSDLAAAEQLADFPEPALRLARAFWPGPLTLVAPLKPGAPIAALATAGLATVAIRVPAHPAMQALLKVTGRPLAAPSANASGSISPTRAAHVVKSLGERIPLVIDGGRTAVGLESTIVAVDAAGLRLLRPGKLGAEELAALAGVPFIETDSGKIEAPGQLASHYAPALPLRLNAKTVRADEWLIGFGAVAGDRTLSATGDLIEAAANLFDALHEADGSGRKGIAVAPIPNTSLGIAINDRLARAAVPS
ncbi:L-threonylcarbamoyladenylate synthase [Sphingomonas vulcanisoli]|uniref:Threonylcarbamoyl-AMP synthase n=1 Tax=Sphingomonas vulcanisoli TaxID=1658060 RepID=A0ABX0TQJ9_9SPHN|nr:L-threonylcarbamoyladenylate synthase [Sphingomonas vulcanisoli]NIJ07808.1 L-threonylcarbamoyladenylate synthase [Sphingomonas vulcanisoli]